MENNNTNPSPNGIKTTFVLDSSKKSYYSLLFLSIFVLVLIVGIGSYFLGFNNGKSSSSKIVKRTEKSTQSTNIYSGEKNSSNPMNSPKNLQNTKMALYNFNGGAYFTSQISAPNDYFATDDNMIISYNTQGGGGIPQIILMKGYQVNQAGKGGYIDYTSALSQTKNDCIVIWSTDGMISIDDWNSQIALKKGNLSEHQAITVGKREAQMYKMVSSEGDTYVAYLPIGNKDNTSYFFQTCNANNKSDFINVIQAIKFRDNVYP